MVGAGLSGSLAAIMLSRRGLRVAVIDRHAACSSDFRAEQIVGDQMRLFDDLGLSAALTEGVRPVLQARNYWLGRKLAPVMAPHYGMPYQNMAQAVRDQIPPDVQVIVGRAADISGGARPTVCLEDGRTVPAKLVVVATGLHTALKQRLGVRQEALSTQRTTTVGFDIASPRCSAADAPVLVHYGSRLEDRIDYLTVFPCGNVLRANLFLFRDPTDPWVRQLRRAPRDTLLQWFPALGEELGAFTAGRVQCRASDVSVARGHALDGVVLIGDAFQTPCPAAGTGITRLAVDVERLGSHALRWFAANDFSATALQSFYDDPIKRRSDRDAVERARFRRGLSVEPSLFWAWQRQNVRVRRFARFALYSLLHGASGAAARGGRAVGTGSGPPWRPAA